MSDRSGIYIQQSAGYKAFIPKPLPPVPSLNIGMEMQDSSKASDGTSLPATQLSFDFELYDFALYIFGVQ